MGDHVLRLFTPTDAYALDLTKTMVERCEQDQWSTHMRACVVGTTAVSAPKQCRDILTVPQNEALEEALAAVEQREADRVPPACVRYEQLLARIERCDKVAPDLRQGLRQRLEQAKASSPDKRTFATMCDQAAGAVQAVARDCP